MFCRACFSVYSLLWQSICSLYVKKHRANHISVQLALAIFLFLILCSPAYSYWIEGGFLGLCWCFIFDIPLRNWLMLNVFFIDGEIAPLSQHKWNTKTRNIWRNYSKVLWQVSMLNVPWIPYCTFSCSLLQ